MFQRAKQMKPTIKLHSFINKAAGNQRIPAVQCLS